MEEKKERRGAGERGRRIDKRKRDAKVAAWLLRRADCLFVGSSHARTNKWKQIISWPHYEKESMARLQRVRSGWLSPFALSFSFFLSACHGCVPQGDSNEANECRNVSSLMPASGPPRIRASLLPFLPHAFALSPSNAHVFGRHNSPATEAPISEIDSYIYRIRIETPSIIIVCIHICFSRNERFCSQRE